MPVSLSIIQMKAARRIWTFILPSPNVSETENDSSLRKPSENKQVSQSLIYTPSESAIRQLICYGMRR